MYYLSPLCVWCSNFWSLVIMSYSAVASYFSHFSRLKHANNKELSPLCRKSSFSSPISRYFPFFPSQLVAWLAFCYWRSHDMLSKFISIGFVLCWCWWKCQNLLLFFDFFFFSRDFSFEFNSRLRSTQRDIM